MPNASGTLKKRRNLFVKNSPTFRDSFRLQCHVYFVAGISVRRSRLKSQITIAVLLSLAASAPAHAATCLRTSDITGSDSTDGKVLVLKMKDGKAWRAQLQPPCPSLRFNGFSWIVKGGQICEGEQILRVVSSPEICAIGKLTRDPSPADSEAR